MSAVLAPVTPSKPLAALSLKPKAAKPVKAVDDVQTNGRDRFVGNLDITCDQDEPLLKESAKRFVLFPICYSEVCPPPDAPHTR